LRICFTSAAEDRNGRCSPLTFVTCFGVPQAPVRNVITDSDNISQNLSTTDGQICIQEELSFLRGDANVDGRFDISDPVLILGCLFLGDACSPCPDATDVNDDGREDITDALHLLSWRFLDVPAPSNPFPECGRDGRPDALDDCERFPLCE
jgi:hypothetical protein